MESVRAKTVPPALVGHPMAAVPTLLLLCYGQLYTSFVYGAFPEPTHVHSRLPNKGHAQASTLQCLRDSGAFLHSGYKGRAELSSHNTVHMACGDLLPGPLQRGLAPPALQNCRIVFNSEHYTVNGHHSPVWRDRVF